MVSLENSTKHIKNWHQFSTTSSRKQGGKDLFPMNYMKPVISLIPKPGEDSTSSMVSVTVF